MGNAGIAPQANPDPDDRNEDGQNRSEPEQGDPLNPLVLHHSILSPDALTYGFSAQKLSHSHRIPVNSQPLLFTADR